MNVLTIGIIGLLTGVIGIGLGGIIGILIKKTDFIFSLLLGLTGGFMMFIVTFHLLPEAFLLGKLPMVLIGVLIGILIIVALEKVIDNINAISYLKTGIILGLSIALHNFPEGLALGSSLIYEIELGKVITAAMLIHNIPEGISIAIPLSLNNISKVKIFLLTILAGVPMGIGSFIGAYIGSISNTFVSICLAIAGGIMLYITCDEIIPTGKALHKGRASSLGVIIGFLIGIILYY
ncbi:ZIP family metal transporter [Tissierella sp. Yu-01]|uniref:ZIP family metal transporter n=1 Tax=Tissierella sp. Yu-01 TaxID=3035694 RepID=UPI00240E39B0|nr:ZIP family metal transporter [Tissierella sp. Yu-01]WFA08682.1 ZIP family metal transporter [Tissierella sp. Yu-01]